MTLTPEVYYYMSMVEISIKVNNQTSMVMALLFYDLKEFVGGFLVKVE